MTIKQPQPDQRRQHGLTQDDDRASTGTERRKRRSTNLILALRYWLESAARRAGAAGLTLADGDGFLIASSLPSAHAEEVAALAPILARPDRTGQRLTDDASLPISIHAMTGFCGRLFLCAIGDEERRREAVRASRPGVQRIIKELAGVPAWSLSLDGV
jgi:predicted regulator of Ras-like GTPase activity (Roadblock/LC7/MglB family)